MASVLAVASSRWGTRNRALTGAPKAYFATLSVFFTLFRAVFPHLRVYLNVSDAIILTLEARRDNTPLATDWERSPSTQKQSCANLYRIWI